MLLGKDKNFSDGERGSWPCLTPTATRHTLQGDSREGEGRHSFMVMAQWSIVRDASLPLNRRQYICSQGERLRLTSEWIRLERLELSPILGGYIVRVPMTESLRRQIRQVENFAYYNVTVPDKHQRRVYSVTESSTLIVPMACLDLECDRPAQHKFVLDVSKIHLQSYGGVTLITLDIELVSLEIILD